MIDRVRRSISEPIRQGQTTDQLWRQEDHGVICTWEQGRRMREEQPGLAERAERGELVPLGWKGGVEKKLKSNAETHGCMWYLATWQGIRNEDLDIDFRNSRRLICSKTGQVVRITPSPYKD
ncbi:MAG: hypothetical protein ACSLE2_12805 [Lysobacterales bacterium]